MIDLKTNLRIEQSKNWSGKLLNENSIERLKEEHYYVDDIPLDGDAPKQFIKVYQFQEDSGVLKSRPKTWNAYIAKTAEKWYPHESIIEYMINRIGQVIGLQMNEVELLRINTQIRFLSKYFLDRNTALVHGAEICGQYLDDDDMATEIANDLNSSRKLFTFEFICDALRSVFPIQCDTIILGLVKMITFDSIVGNNDRHFYNWGVIMNKKKTGQTPQFAPIYDSARGLLWNIDDKNILSKYSTSHIHGRNKVYKYMDDACPRISIEGNDLINHYGLIKFLKNYNTDYKVVIEDLASEANEKLAVNTLKEEFYPFFIKERSELTTLVLQTRFKKTRDI